MTNYAELEIGFHRQHTDAYLIELRFRHPENQAEVAPQRGDCRIDTKELLALESDPQRYGEELTSKVFEDPAIREWYGQVKAAVEASDLFLRVRLLIGTSAPELHTVRWELLRDPQSNLPLATSEKVILSRFMNSQDWRNVRLRRKAALRALVAVSAPENLPEQFAKVDRNKEVERAQANLTGIQVHVLGQTEPLTLERLIAALRQDVDILYLVCHGVLPKSKVSQLYLQDKDGKVLPVSGKDLAERISELRQAPRLIVLASCESAGTGQTSNDVNGAFQASLAPRLAEAGVPAVIAMQGKISMETVESAMPIFFKELLKEGQIDHALSVARGAVRNNSDFWMPALLMRLSRGCIWYEPGFADSTEDFQKWKSIVHHVRNGKAVAILGSGVGESICGDSRDLARQLALANDFPLAPHQRDDLPQVSQYLSVSQDPNYAAEVLLQQLRAEVIDRHPYLPKERSLPKLLGAVVESEGFRSPPHPYHVLAQLPISVYICATPDTLMFKALKHVGKNPTTLFANWRPSHDKAPVEPLYAGTPTPESPLVYYMLGVYGKNDSLVLTEDDYFDYMIATSTYKLIPRVVRSALVSNSLLFLGFQLMDWSFRVLFRLIRSLEGIEKSATMSHVGVQVNPREHDLADAARARRYLQQYFTKAANLEVYCGSVEDFLGELYGRFVGSAEGPLPLIEGGEDEWV